jgi:hypothetical protein
VVLAMSCLLFTIAVSGATPGRGSKSRDDSKVAGDTSVLTPRNLQVLPKDLPLADLVQLMYRYREELGVQCTFCHVLNPQTLQFDFASDENPEKQTARIMIGMLRDINDKYLAQVGDRRYAVPISCGNCHQGQTYPPVFEPPR